MRIKEIRNRHGYSLQYGKNILKLRKLEKQYYEFEKIHFVNQQNTILYNLLEKRFYAFVKKNKITIVSENRAIDRNQNRFMKESGLKKYSKQSFSKNLKDFKSNYEDIFEYRSPGEAGLLKFFRASRTSADNPIKQYKQFQKYFNKIKKYLRNDTDIENWKIVSLKKINIGVIMPYVFPENPKQGTILNFGLKPEFRGRGYGRIVHAKALELLKEMGVKKYLGSTEITNHAMLRIFELNGCKKRSLRHFFYAE
jgi:ribosomal protein S18 acetylase RimI-like enzyme